jgi:dihydrofolate reductase
MSKVVVINHVTLDGVMQSPGRAEEDTRDGFTHGGWSSRNADDQVVSATYARVEEGGGLQLLLGRRSFEGMLGYWNTHDSPFKEGLNNAPKYVASRTLAEPLPWPNSTLLRGDVGDAVTELKRTLSGDLTVMGSGELIHTLMREDLIDEYLLFIHPLVLGTGRRLFGNGIPPASLTLVESATTKTGVVIARYETATPTR